MRIAVTGVSGFIGSYIARALSDHGHQVTGLVRDTSPREHVQDVVDRFVVGDHANDKIWPDLLDGAEAVVHNSLDRSSPRDQLDTYLQKNLVASIRLLDASAPRPFVYISSVAAISDILPRWNGNITPDHPARPAGRYGAMKAAVERFCFAEHLGNGRRMSIVRPSAVYGIDRTLERSHGHSIIQTLRDTGRFDRSGGGKFVHVEDVAAVVTACLEQEQANGQVYNLADCYARWGDWAVIAAELLGIDDATIDLSSPASPKNTFDKSNIQSLGLPMDRGHGGIREHLQALIRAMDA